MLTKRVNSLIRFSVIVLSLAIAMGVVAHEDVPVVGISAPVTVYQSADGVPTVAGSSDADVYFVQGWIHARDRFFQMDFNRRTAHGTLAEMLGQPALANDIQLRTLGLGRAALATFRALDGESKAILQSYANGVNAYLQSAPLPPEYTVLELTQARRWTPVDSLAIAKLLAFGLSFDLDIEFTIRLGTYQAVGNIAGFDGTALFFEDTHRTQPPDDRVTVPDFFGSIVNPKSDGPADTASVEAATVNTAKVPRISDGLLRLAQKTKAQVQNVPLLAKAMNGDIDRGGSNWWVLSGDHTESGYPMLMNDPHLALNTPATFNEMTLVFQHEAGWSVSGVSFAGVPGIVQGCNDFMCWGSTVHPMDVTDVFQEELRLNGLGLPTHSVHNGEAEPLRLVFQSYFVNGVGDGEADNLSRANVGYDAGGITFIVPRRNNGPILSLDGGSGLSVAYTGWGPTFEFVAFAKINKAKSMDEFKDALQYFDVGSQNFAYADIDGNIAYFAGAENPIRSDLQTNQIDGVPPYIIRDGTGAVLNDWLPVTNPQPNQAVPFEIMRFDEMPQIVNPESGYIANANNDPVGVSLDNNPFNQIREGGGLYYLNSGYASLRMGRIDRVLQELIDSGQPISVAQMQALQANNQLLDAEILMGLIGPVFQQAASDPDFPLTPVINLLLAWDFSTPTGIKEGYDPGDDPANLPDPSPEEIQASVAATVFAAFRGQLIKNTVDATMNALQLGNALPGNREAYNALIHHLRQFPERQGVGASGLPFISVPGIDDPNEALATVVLGSLQQALELLASDEFAPAFGNSTDVMDYRWGKLHRIVFDHPLGVDPFNIPNGGGFSDLAADLPGVARAGGYEAVDASRHNARANSVNDFMFGAGPARRFWGVLDPMGITGAEVIPGGNSGVFLSPFYSNQLGRWLTNDYHPLILGEEAAEAAAIDVDTFVPAP